MKHIIEIAERIINHMFSTILGLFLIYKAFEITNNTTIMISLLLMGFVCIFSKDNISKYLNKVMNTIINNIKAK